MIQERMVGFDPSILRAYDVRGVVEETLFKEDFYWLGYILGIKLRDRLLGATPTMAVGYDGRLTSETFNTYLCKGLNEAGVRIIDVGCGPTPLVSFAHYYLETDGCLMITGSHNPASFNGLKITFNFAPFYGEEIQELQEARQKIDQEDLPVIAGGTLDRIDISQDYEDRLLEDMNFTKPLKVVWDMGNGAMGDVVTRLTKTLAERGCIHSILLNADIDGTFPAHHPDPTVSENLQQLIGTVKDTGADLGVAFDGDGDRLGVVDGRGRIIWGDQLMILFAKDILALQPGAPIIADVKASGILFDKIRELGGRPIMEKTGHSHIKASLAFHKAPLAGELSGHMFFKDRYFGYDDALYAALRLLEILSNADQDLQTMIDELPQSFASPEVRWSCLPGEKGSLVEAVKKNLQRAQADYNPIDGIRVTREYGWWGIRASNTEDAVTVRMEAYTQDAFVRIEEDLRRFLPLEFKSKKL